MLAYKEQECKTPIWRAVLRESVYMSMGDFKSFTSLALECKAVLWALLHLTLCYVNCATTRTMLTRALFLHNSTMHSSPAPLREEVPFSYFTHGKKNHVATSRVPDKKKSFQGNVSWLIHSNENKMNFFNYVVNSNTLYTLAKKRVVT